MSDQDYQAVAMNELGKGLQGAGDAIKDGASKIGAYIEQGPNGLRVLAFIGGLGSIALSIMTVINPFNALLNITAYVIAAYQFVFSSVCIVLEMNPEWLSGDKHAKMHSFLEDQCKFLLRVLGRGLFYIFLGSLWLMQASIVNIPILVVGGYLVFIGVLYVMMHFGIAPDRCISVTRKEFQKGVDAVRGSSNQGDSTA